ncbi:MAG: cytochrome c oxidase subunit 3 family protein [Acidobacteria bacterium]|nr:cytochrome c oxidase subunit 3 family protein [Acidobacteriota bacterium]MBV9481822.1 cytochrome c oxidase subunit 3 family protein [Acidobacteriota bacterium]
MGMWVFLITEIMFFGGMFAGYMIYRFMYYQAWLEGSQHMDFWYGSINTVVLLCSSLTMALAVRSTQLGLRRSSVVLLLITILFGLAFLGIKGVEYYGHIVDEHQFPGPSFRFAGAYTAQVEMFFSFYFAMTGFHALHMVIGVGLVSFVAYHAWKGRYHAHYYTPVENVGLYWHFVDIVWIYLYPLFYLISHIHK